MSGYERMPLDSVFEAALRSLVVEIPDFPKQGMNFKDIMPVFHDPAVLGCVLDRMRDYIGFHNPDVIVGIESRGYLFSAPLACSMKIPHVTVRKPGKLPGKVVTAEYTLEYGAEKLEMQRSSIQPGTKAVVIDDVLATDGTAKAAASLVESLGGRVAGFCFLAELDFLDGRTKLDGYDIFSLLHYER